VNICENLLNWWRNEKRGLKIKQKKRQTQREKKAAFGNAANYLKARKEKRRKKAGEKLNKELNGT